MRNTSKTFNRLKQIAKDNNLTIAWFDRIDDSRLSSIWYGGKIFSLSTDKYILEFHAVGDVRINVYEDGKHHSHLSDKANVGYIGKAMEEQYGIRDDKSIYKDITIIDGHEYRFDFDTHNWIELFFYDKIKNEPIDIIDSAYFNIDEIADKLSEKNVIKEILERLDLGEQDE